MDTEIKQNEYVNNGGSRCPFCGSEVLEGLYAPVVEEGTAYQEVTCFDCESKWRDEYKLIGFKVVENSTCWNFGDLKIFDLRGYLVTLVVR